MNPKYEKLKNLLKELFQLDRPDLDFGLYRVMHAKSGEVTQFLEKDLLPQVQAAFAQYQTADKAELEKELAKVMAGVEAAGMDPEQSPKVQELRAKLQLEAVDRSGLESEVYDHLYSFFRRYYSEGDFLAKRVYKAGVYAIPYEGEEVTLHWANKDQYYIKTSEYLRDYAFRLRPDDEKKPLRVHFRLADAAEGEHGNVRAAEGKERVFMLAAGATSSDFITKELGEQGQELVIRFKYRPATLNDWPDDIRAGKTKPPAQKDLTALAAKRILSVQGKSVQGSVFSVQEENQSPPLLKTESLNTESLNTEHSAWLTELAKPHTLASGEQADYTRLEAHLRRYTARNTFDYFIHKDLGTFLHRELDFFIKNEVMHLDDVENETAPRVEQYLAKIKVIRRIGGKIIDFLAQLENFQKKLWLKKKFVVETQWCIRVDCIPEDFYPEIAANTAQREEWIALLAIDENAGDAVTPGYSVPLTTDFLAANPSLMVDTRHFDANFTARLLEAMGDVDSQTDGLLFHSENFQALSLMQARYLNQVKCIYIDPPYNTGNDGFAYKDNYQHSSWLTMMTDRLEYVRNLFTESSIFFSSIDDNESAGYRILLNSLFGETAFESAMAWVKRYAPPPDVEGIGYVHETILAYSPSGKFKAGLLPMTDDQKGRYDNPDEDPRGPWKAADYTCRYTADERPTLYYPITNPNTGQEVWPKRTRVWAMSRESHNNNVRDNLVWWGKNGTNTTPALKNFMGKIKQGIAPSSLLPHQEVGHTDESAKELRDIIPGIKLTPKPTRLLQRLGTIADMAGRDVLFDFFAGSGTTAHAVINLNREDGGQRKFILVEMGDYFDTVLLPRIKKVTFTPEWKDGKPKRLATPEEAERGPRIVKVVRLESYEDTLNNLKTRRTPAQQTLLDDPDAQGADGLREQYLLRYLLDVETRGSQSLLNTDAFADPTAYQLKVKCPGTDESRLVPVDLLETFNWLIGLTVQHIAAPLTLSAEFERDGEGRLQIRGRLRSVQVSVFSFQEENADPSLLKTESLKTENFFTFRTVTGTTPDGRKTLIIWRKLTGNPEQDNLVLDEWFKKQGYSSRDSEFDLIYVNGGNNLENLKAPDDLWKVRLIEEDFQRLMFAEEGV